MVVHPAVPPQQDVNSKIAVAHPCLGQITPSGSHKIGKLALRPEEKTGARQSTSREADSTAEDEGCERLVPHAKDYARGAEPFVQITARPYEDQP
jgi:hypothetical protein